MFNESLFQLNDLCGIETCHLHCTYFVHSFTTNIIGTKGEINKSPGIIINKSNILKLHGIKPSGVSYNLFENSRFNVINRSINNVDF